MKYYKEMLEMGCFTWHDVCEIVGNKNSASNLIQNYIKKGYIKSVKRNLYVALDLVMGEPVANKFRIASSITDSAYVSHRSAFEYHGCVNQVRYDVNISSDSAFAEFDFEGITYYYRKSKFHDGVISENDVSVTDLERTLTDCIDAFDKIMGLEELLNCIELIPSVNEEKLAAYLKKYDKRFMYQKVGYILENFKSELHLSEAFFDKCHACISDSTRYLYRQSNYADWMYNKKWRLIVPENLMNTGDDEYGDI